MTGFVDLSSAVVTGIGIGIGGASAIALGKRGARVVVSDIDRDRPFAVADTIGSSAVGLACDVDAYLFRVSEEATDDSDQ